MDVPQLNWTRCETTEGDPMRAKTDIESSARSTADRAAREPCRRQADAQGHLSSICESRATHRRGRRAQGNHGSRIVRRTAAPARGQGPLETLMREVTSSPPTYPRARTVQAPALGKPASVIVSHANKVGTVQGKVRPRSKTKAFLKAVKVPAVVPLSGRTMEFGAGGACIAGCDLM